MEKDSEKAREPHKTAERHAIKEVEPPDISLREQPHQTEGSPLACGAGAGIRPLLREEGENEQHRNDRNDGQSKDQMPAVTLREARGHQHRDHGPAVAGSRDAHRHALMLGGIPPAGQGKGDGKAGPRNSEEQPEAQDLVEGLRSPPAPEQGNQDYREGGDSHFLRAEPIAEIPDQYSKRGPAQQGNGHHQTLLGRAQLQVLSDEDPQSPDEDPNHKTDIKIEKGRKERPWMTASYRSNERLHNQLPVFGEANPKGYAGSVRHVSAQASRRLLRSAQPKKAFAGPLPTGSLYERARVVPQGIASAGFISD